MPSLDHVTSLANPSPMAAVTKQKNSLSDAQHHTIDTHSLRPGGHDPLHAGLRYTHTHMHAYTNGMGCVCLPKYSQSKKGP